MTKRRAVPRRWPARGAPPGRRTVPTAHGSRKRDALAHMRVPTRPRTRADHQKLTFQGQLTLLDVGALLGPSAPQPPAWDKHWRRCLVYRRCGEVLPDGWRCRFRAKVGSDRCTLHHGETP